jgi:hypothetical protein
MVKHKLYIQQTFRVSLRVPEMLANKCGQTQENRCIVGRFRSFVLLCLYRCLCISRILAVVVVAGIWPLVGWKPATLAGLLSALFTHHFSPSS